jgi:hypothetical protein
MSDGSWECKDLLISIWQFSIFFSMTFERFGCENKTKGKQKRTKDEQLILSNTDTLLG